jgi:hypothetical protein
MLWKSAKYVGFGYSGPYVVARYCTDATAKPLAEFAKPPLENIRAYGLNVCPNTGCVTCPKPVPGLGYNNCYNEKALKYANDLRKLTKSGDLVLDYDIARKAQTAAKTFNYRGSAATTDDTRPAVDCAALHFHQTIPAKIDTLATSGDAIIDWWNGSSQYDAEKGKPKGDSTDSKRKSRNYTTLVWKAGTKVGFGVEGSWVVAWICGVKNDPSVKVTKENVPTESCTKTAPTGTKHYNKCFNDMMLTALNTKRKDHIVKELTLETADAFTL